MNEATIWNILILGSASGIALSGLLRILAVFGIVRFSWDHFVVASRCFGGLTAIAFGGLVSRVAYMVAVRALALDALIMGLTGAACCAGGLYLIYRYVLRRA